MEIYFDLMSLNTFLKKHAWTVFFFFSLNVLKVNYPPSTDLTPNYAINLSCSEGNIARVQ